MSVLKIRAKRVRHAAAFCGLLTLGLSHSAIAKNLCVNSGGTGGCYATIGAAVTAAAPNDTINIGTGQFSEAVIIGKPLSLVGAGPDNTIINAKGLANGIYVDGLDNPGLANVLIANLTVINANFEGILVTNTNYTLISNNHIASNDQALNYAAATCGTQPVFETSEAEDCGEGVHLVGTFAVTVANNVIEMNSGGILISDETGQAYENIITSNSVRDNTLDCGITLASHSPSPAASSKLPYGVFSNTVSGNSINGNGIVGQGAGVGIFAPGPGNLAFGNKVIGNSITNNGLPGVTMHNHAAPPGAPGINLNNNVIMGNYISGNAADVDDPASPGTAGIHILSVAPVYATEILENTIVNEAAGVVIDAPGGVDVHLNNLPSGIGISNLSKSSINATMNFFGCATGPGTAGCGTAAGAGTISAPWMGAPVGTAPAGTAAKPRQ